LLKFKKTAKINVKKYDGLSFPVIFIPATIALIKDNSGEQNIVVIKVVFVFYYLFFFLVDNLATNYLLLLV